MTDKTKPPVSEVFDQAMKNYEQALRTGLKFQEETGTVPQGPFHPLGSVQQKAGKIIHAWAWVGDADAKRIVSNMVRVEQPRGSGRWLIFPEIDRCGWFDLTTAQRKINPAQGVFLDRLAILVGP